MMLGVLGNMQICGSRRKDLVVSRYTFYPGDKTRVQK